MAIQHTHLSRTTGLMTCKEHPQYYMFYLTRKLTTHRIKSNVNFYASFRSMIKSRMATLAKQPSSGGGLANERLQVLIDDLIVKTNHCSKLVPNGH